MMNRIAALFVLFILATTHAADWPTYLHDNARVGATVENLKTPLKLQWVYTSPAPPELAWSGPRSAPIERKEMRHRVAFDRAIDVAVVGESLFFGSSVDNKVYCVNAKTGQPKWEFFTDGPIRLSPTVWDNKVYIGSDDGFIYCLGAEGGNVVWKLRVGPADERLLARGRMISRWPVRTGVMIDDGVAYFGAGVFPHETVYLCAADAKTGKIVWRNDRISQKNAGRNELSPQGYLLASSDQLFVPSGRSLPAAFSRKTGEQIYQKKYSWRTTAGGVVGGSKVVLADGQMYASGPHHFLAMDQKTGATGFAWVNGRQLTLSGDQGFVANGKEVVAMDRVKHAKATAERQKLNVKLHGLRRNRTLPRNELNQQIKELEDEMAKLSQIGVQWSTPSEFDASLVLAGDLVFAGGVDGVIALDAESGKEVWNAKVDGLASGLAVASGCLFVSTDLGKIYGFSSADSAAGREVASLPESRTANPYADSKHTAMYQEAAEQIIKQTDIDRGFCLVVGSERGQLVYELAKRTDLRVYGIEPDEKKAAESRKLLDSAGLHGHRVTIVHGDPAKMPFSNYFANLVVSDTLLLTGQVPGNSVEIARW